MRLKDVEIHDVKYLLPFIINTVLSGIVALGPRPIFEEDP